MTSFHLVDPTAETSTLAEMLVRHGAIPAIDADLMIVAASSVEEARERLGRLSDDERARCLLVGISETLGDRTSLSTNSLAGFLDQYAPIGVLRLGADPRHGAFSFIGKKSLAKAVGSPVGAGSTSRDYGGYMRCLGDDAGAFVLRYLRAAGASAAEPADAYAAYLRTHDRRACAQSLDDMLVADGSSDEVMLWRAWCAGESRATLARGAWRNRHVHLGVSPPPSAAVGELWFDVCELSLMVHAGRAWLGTRPTARWQMRGFLDVAERAARDVQVRPPYVALDPKRLYAAAGGAVSDLTTGEATLYAWWYGKTVPHLFDWQSAVEHLPPEQVKALWGTSEKEWTSTKLADDEAARVFVTPTTIDEDPSELAEDDARAPSMIAGEYTHHPFLGFRTSVLVQSGLLQTVSSWHVLVEDVRLSSLLDRSSFR